MPKPDCPHCGEPYDYVFDEDDDPVTFDGNNANQVCWLPDRQEVIVHVNMNPDSGEPERGRPGE